MNWIRALRASTLALLVAAAASGQAPASAASSDPVLVGAGDIADCKELSGAAKTAALLDHIEGTVFTLGDNAYTNGTARQFADCYDPTWGRHKARTRPAVGNHEYGTAVRQRLLRATSAPRRAIRRRATTATTSARGT